MAAIRGSKLISGTSAPSSSSSSSSSLPHRRSGRSRRRPETVYDEARVAEDETEVVEGDDSEEEMDFSTGKNVKSSTRKRLKKEDIDDEEEEEEDLEEEDAGSEDENRSEFSRRKGRSSKSRDGNDPRSLSSDEDEGSSTAETEVTPKSTRNKRPPPTDSSLKGGSNSSGGRKDKSSKKQKTPSSNISSISKSTSNSKGNSNSKSKSNSSNNRNNRNNRNNNKRRPTGVVTSESSSEEEEDDEDTVPSPSPPIKGGGTKSLLSAPPARHRRRVVKKGTVARSYPNASVALRRLHPPPSASEVENLPLSCSMASLLPHLVHFSPASVASSVLSLYNSDPNGAQIVLLQLLFHSVGGSIQRQSFENCNLDDLSEEEWIDAITTVVSDMSECDMRLVACGSANLCQVAAEKSNNLLAPPPSPTGITNVMKEYTSRYVLFFMEVCRQALADPAPERPATASDFSSPRSLRSQEDASALRSVEVVRSLLSRLTELVGVGQPDVRHAAVLACYAMSKSMLSHAAMLLTRKQKLERMTAGASTGAGKKGEGASRRARAMGRIVEELERECSDLVFSGVFAMRYRDSNEHVRAVSLAALSAAAASLPHAYLSDRYLKYFGWLASDKSSYVRHAALTGTLRPFVLRLEEGDQRIDLNAMTHFVAKFRGRIVDCLQDVEEKVRSVAMRLLLHLLREGFLDDRDIPDSFFHQVNVCAINPDMTPQVRTMATEFVVEQLEAFEEEGRQSTQGMAGGGLRVAVQRIDALAGWCAHAISDGPIDAESAPVHLADLLIDSLRSLPAHASLPSNFPALLQAIHDDSIATTSEGNRAGDKVDMVKQRVLVRMLCRGAAREVEGVSSPEFLRYIHPDLLSQETTQKRRRRVTVEDTRRHEDLSKALASALPNLLAKFSGDNVVLGQILSLPPLILPGVYNLPSRKVEFVTLVKRLEDFFRKSHDRLILTRCAVSLGVLSSNGSARQDMARISIQKNVDDLKKTIEEIMPLDEEGGYAQGSPDTRRSTSISLIKKKRSEKKPNEYALSHALTKLMLLSQRCEITDFFSSEEELLEFVDLVVEGTSARLSLQKERGLIDTLVQTEEEVLDISSGVESTLNFLLSCVAWKFYSLLNQEVEVDDIDTIENDETEKEAEEQEEGDGTEQDQMLLQIRTKLMTLLTACFDLLVPDMGEEHDIQTSFFLKVQVCAHKVGCDLRTLFVKTLEDAANPKIRACALSEDASLIRGSVRFFRSQEEKLRGNELLDIEDAGIVRSLLLPLCRSLVTGWEMGNRREAGVILGHLTGSGQEAAALVAASSRALKRTDCVRLLEAQMASLRQSYNDWMEDEPEEPEGGDDEEALKQFEEMEEAHNEQFGNLEFQASRFSASLGVGKLSDPNLESAIVGFIKEGIRFAFSRTDSGDDELLLGGRLSFLSIISKYVMWVKKSEEKKIFLEEVLDAEEKILRYDQDFEEVLEEDLVTLANFRNSLGIKPYVEDSGSSRTVSSARPSVEEGSTDPFSSQKHRRVSSDVSGDISSQLTPTSTPNASRGRSYGSSVRSHMSSTRASLSPLYEEDASAVEEESAEKRTEGGEEPQTQYSDIFDGMDAFSARS